MLAAQTADFGPAGLSKTMEAASPGYSKMTGMLGNMDKLNTAKSGLDMMGGEQQSAPPPAPRPLPQNDDEPMAAMMGKRMGIDPKILELLRRGMR
jgi:hypothetical protein